MSVVCSLHCTGHSAQNTKVGARTVEGVSYECQSPGCSDGRGDGTYVSRSYAQLVFTLFFFFVFTLLLDHECSATQ